MCRPIFPVHMKPFFTCYFDGHGGRWRSTCVDFDLTVFGASAEHVQDLMRQVVVTYMADAQAEAPADRERLLNRRSPWHVRLGWRLNVLASRIGALFGIVGRPANRITMPCPA